MKAANRRTRTHARVKKTVHSAQGYVAAGSSSSRADARTSFCWAALLSGISHTVFSSRSVAAHAHALQIETLYVRLLTERFHEVSAVSTVAGRGGGGRGVPSVAGTCNMNMISTASIRRSSEPKTKNTHKKKGCGKSDKCATVESL